LNTNNKLVIKINRMIKSMTGFGAVTKDSAERHIVAEVKSLNSKYLDASIRLPKEYADKEIEIRNLLTNTLERGKVSVAIDIQSKLDVKPKVSVNRDLMKIYYKDLLETADIIGADKTDLFRLALQMPKAINSELAVDDVSEEWEELLAVLKDAIKRCDDFRISEGNTLKKNFESYLNNIETLLAKIVEADPRRIASVRDRIKAHMTEYVANEQIDNNRFEQELIFYIEKLDISEEKVRLKSHLDYFLETINATDANGKKLGFIAQEIGREINTIGSKANDAEIQRYVVQMKDELEKIKEQALNIL
jgi:uncharacterized protein (TIGR00255 family)